MTLKLPILKLSGVSKNRGGGAKRRDSYSCALLLPHRNRRRGGKNHNLTLSDASLNALLLCRSRCAPIIFPWRLQDKSGLLPCTHTQNTMHGNNSSWGVMNDALVPTGPCRCMFKWMGLNLTIEMTGHSFFGARGRLHEWFVATRGLVIDAPWGKASESAEKDEGKPPLS